MLDVDKRQKLRYAFYLFTFLFQLLNCFLSIAILNRPDTLLVCVDVFSQENNYVHERKVNKARAKSLTTLVTSAIMERHLLSGAEMSDLTNAPRILSHR